MAKLLLLSLLLQAGFLLASLGLAGAYDFRVGGRDGWVLNPLESYGRWSSRMRFKINDNLVFRYKKGEDSVLQVKKEDFDSCNTSNPIKKLHNGDSVFTFDRSGPFFFISGKEGHCSRGQKLALVVLSVRGRKPAQPLVSRSSPRSVSPSPSLASSSSRLSPSPAPLSSSTPPSNAPPAAALTPASAPGVSGISLESPSASTGGGRGAPASPSPSSNSTSRPAPSSAPSRAAPRSSFGLLALLMVVFFLG